MSNLLGTGALGGVAFYAVRITVRPNVFPRADRGAIWLFLQAKLKARGNV